MEFFAPLFTFIVDSNKKLSYRAVTVLIAIITVLLVDNILGFSYYHNIDKKIEVVNNVNQALKDTSNSVADKLILKSLKEDAIKHNSIKDHIYEFLFIKSWDFNINLSKISNILLLITACSFPLMMMVATLIYSIPHLKKKKLPILEDDNQTIFLKIAGLEFIGYIICAAEAKLLLRIPLIYNCVYINCFVNLILNFLFLYAFVKLIVDKKRPPIFK